MTMLRALDGDDPSRTWFDLWRCALTTAIAPEAGMAEIDALLPRVRDDARAAHDWILSQFLVNKATALAMLGRLEEAPRFAEEALARAPSGGQDSRDQALALLLWILYLTGARCDDVIHEAVAAQRQDLGLAALCAGPDALSADGSIEQRAARLVTATRRRHPADVPTPFLLAFAYLALEDGDDARAEAVVGTAEIYDSSTLVALLHLLARLHGWTDETWAAERDAAIGRYLSPDHEAATERGFTILGEEADRWERRLSQPRRGRARPAPTPPTFARPPTNFRTS